MYKNFVIYPLLNSQNAGGVGSKQVCHGMNPDRTRSRVAKVNIGYGPRSATAMWSIDNGFITSFRPLLTPITIESCLPSILLIVLVKFRVSRRLYTFKPIIYNLRIAIRWRIQVLAQAWSTASLMLILCSFRRFTSIHRSRL
jgi:hypothetical protein